MVKLYSGRIWTGRRYCHLWPIKILGLCSSLEFHRGSDHFWAFQFPSPQAWSSLLALIVLIMWLLSRWGHSAQQQGLEIFTGSVFSPAACHPWALEPRTDLCSSGVCTFAGVSGCCWTLSLLLHHQIGVPFFGHYGLLGQASTKPVNKRMTVFSTKKCKKQNRHVSNIMCLYFMVKTDMLTCSKTYHWNT